MGLLIQFLPCISVMGFNGNKALWALWWWACCRRRNVWKFKSSCNLLLRVIHTFKHCWINFSLSRYRTGFDFSWWSDSWATYIPPLLFWGGFLFCFVVLRRETVIFLNQPCFLIFLQLVEKKLSFPGGEVESICGKGLVLKLLYRYLV